LVRSQSAIKRNVGAEAVSIFLLKIVYYCLSANVVRTVAECIP